MTRLILFLIQCKLGLKPYERFRFTNQKSNAIYYFSNTRLWKDSNHISYRLVEESGVSLNWLLNPDCKIEKV
jgi:hypothetical protein